MYWVLSSCLARGNPSWEDLGVLEFWSTDLQFLTLISEGRSHKEIADTLTLSISTIVCYRGRLLDRLQLTTTGELIAYPRAHALTARPMVVIKRGRIGFNRTQAPRSELMRGPAGVRETNGDKR